MQETLKTKKVSKVLSKINISGFCLPVIDMKLIIFAHYFYASLDEFN
jgi:hypothetical protein